VSAPPHSGTLGPRRSRSTVDRTRPSRFTTHGPSPRPYPLKNKSPAEIPRHFALRPLGFSKINPQSKNFTVRSEDLKNIYKKVPSLRKIHKNSFKTSKIHIFSTTTPNLVILVPKFSESLPFSFCAFI
jgi:hypothetical protein